MEWISVKDRLPEEDIEVLIWIKKGIGPYVTTYTRSRLHWDRKAPKWDIPYIQRLVTHWAEIQPPK